MRTKGLAVMIAIGQTLLIVPQYANPVAIAAIGWKYWLFFFGMFVIPHHGVLHVPGNKGVDP
jgi:hypothetical protein